jgi:hypothetical protein
MLGVDFEVRDPPELVQRIRELARRYAQAVPGEAAPPTSDDFG